MLPATAPGRPPAGQAPSFALTTTRPMLNDVAGKVNGRRVIQRKAASTAHQSFIRQ